MTLNVPDEFKPILEQLMQNSKSKDVEEFVNKLVLRECITVMVGSDTENYRKTRAAELAAKHGFDVR